MSPEVGDSREILAYFYLCCKPFPFNLWRCGRLVFFRLLFAVANNCLCQISDFENEFSVAICQIQQSTIATASLGLLKPAAVVRKRVLLEKFSALIPLRGLFLLLARHSVQAPSALASCVGSVFRFFAPILWHLMAFGLSALNDI